MSNNIKKLYCKFCKCIHHRTEEFYWFRKNGNINVCKKQLKDCALKYNKKCYKDPIKKEKTKKAVSKWYFQNKEKKASYYKEYQRKRLLTDPLFKLRKNLRSRLSGALKRKNWSKSLKLKEYVGCSLKELQIHLENQFSQNMTWENYGKWHIDHIIPLISAQNEQELLKLCHYSNLQPLWATENLAKGSKI